MKLRDLVIAQEALGRLLTLELPAAVSYKVARVARPIEAELRAYEQSRVKLVQRLGEEAGQGQIMVLPEKAAEFNKEMNTLLDVDVDVKIRTIDPGILGEVGIRPGDIMALWFLFEEEK